MTHTDPAVPGVIVANNMIGIVRAVAVQRETVWML